MWDLGQGVGFSVPPFPELRDEDGNNRGSPSRGCFED